MKKARKKKVNQDDKIIAPENRAGENAARDAAAKDAESEKEQDVGAVPELAGFISDEAFAVLLGVSQAKLKSLASWPKFPKPLLSRGVRSYYLRSGAEAFAAARGERIRRGEPPVANPDAYLDREGVRAALGVSHSSLVKLRRHPAFPAVAARLGRREYFRKKEVSAFKRLRDEGRIVDPASPENYDSRKYMRAFEAARLLGVTLQTMLDRSRTGRGPRNYRAGRLILYERGDVAACLANRNHRLAWIRNPLPRGEVLPRRRNAAQAAASPCYTIPEAAGLLSVSPTFLRKRLNSWASEPGVDRGRMLTLNKEEFNRFLRLKGWDELGGEHVRAPDLALALGVHIRVVHKMIKRGQIPPGVPFPTGQRWKKELAAKFVKEILARREAQKTGDKQ